VVKALGFVHSKKIFVLVNGFNLTGFLNKLDSNLTGKTAETSVFGTEDEQFIAGLQGSTLSGEGFFDGTVGAVDETLSDILDINGDSNIYTWILQGNQAGVYGFVIDGMETQYSVSGTIDDACKISLAAQSSTSRHRCLILQEYKSRTGSAVGLDYDILVEHTMGGILYLHVNAVSDSLDLELEHSVDEVTWTNLETVPIITGTSPQVIKVDVSDSIHRYVRLSYDNSAGSSLFLAALKFNT
jgi:hypothetical protein